MEDVLRGERYIRDEIGKVMGMTMTPRTKTLIAGLRTKVDAEIVKLEALKLVT